jgi:SAM-dependent methyltransferase/uncharacterized protein YbaR (Trm112 family)
MQTHINQSSEIKFSSEVEKKINCPICHSSLDYHYQNYQCQNYSCQTTYPIIDGVPILINENVSIFTIEDYLNYRGTYFDLKSENKIKKFIRQNLPDIDINIKAKENYQKLEEILLSRSQNPVVLILGGSVLGNGIESIINNPKIEFVESDVSFGGRTKLIFDAHSMPFADKSFDAVIVQAVLEHVVDPWCCVEEIFRVLKDDGLVYAETPFMQQVHGGCYDFTRFTYLGHRRLFRKFEEICSGAGCGPSMALAWSYKYFLFSFSCSKLWRKIIEWVVRLTIFPLKYLDYLLIDKNGTLDAASGYYFLGKKSEYILSDKELIKLYKGNN